MKYCSDKAHKTNSATATLNKWLFKNTPEECLRHTFRNGMRDRLNAIESLANILVWKGGSITAGVRSAIGNGYAIVVLGRMKNEFIGH